MKKLLMAVIILVMAVATQAQTYVWQSFDSSVKDGYWDMNTIYQNQGSATAALDVSDLTTDKKEGVGCVKINYTIGAGDGWGGYVVRTTVSPTLPNYINLSTGTELTFWYKVTKPVVTSQAGTVFMELKLGDFDSDNKRDLWYMEMPINLADASGTWKEVKVSLMTFKSEGGDKTKEWALQFGDGDKEIQLDKIKGSEIALVYITAGSGTNSPTATGEILLDGMAVTGDRYAPPITNFDNTASSWAFDDMGWAGDAGKGAVKLTDEATDKVEGAGALKFEYTVNCSQDWGGYVNFSKNITKPTKFEERTGLVLWVKNSVPHKAVNTKRLSMRFTIIENNTGVDEAWVCKVPVDWSKVTGWTRIDLPLKQKPLVKVGSENDFPTDGFCQPWWDEKGDKAFNTEAIKNLKIELSAEGNTGPYGGGTKGEKLTGTILFDIVQQSGFQTVDNTKPGKPKNLAAAKGNYSNLISWGDVDNEGTEKYDVYASKSAITSLTAAGVEKVGPGIARGVQVFEHVLKTPKTDKDVTLYYAVQAIDKNKNEGEIGTAGPITNKAKGVPTIALKTINFKADGVLDEWTGITPFDIYPSKGGHIMTSWKVDNDADCSADCYIAIDKDYLYLGYNVNDDKIYADMLNYYNTGYNWALDAVDLEIGFYNLIKPHTSYQATPEPDYHLRFNKLRARNDSAGKDSLLLPGTNYYWAEKFPTGYIVEAKIKLTDLAKSKGASEKIYVKEGYRIPINFVIMDNDGGTNPSLDANREGQLSYSVADNNDGYQNPSLWTYTWLGDTDVISTDVEETELPVKYALEQNYPNPFNPTTQIKYSIANAGYVSLKVFDVLGREVVELVNKHQEVGQYKVNFNASGLSSGIYFYRIESGSFVSVKKLMLVK